MQVTSFIHSRKGDLQKIKDSMGADILNTFDSDLFTPINSLLKGKVKYAETKSYPSLIKALKSGKVLYIMSRQGFIVKNGSESLYAELNELATFNSIEKMYKANYDSMPIEVKSIIATTINHTENTANAITKILATGSAYLLARNMQNTLKPKLETIATVGTKEIEVVYNNHYSNYAYSIEKGIKDFSTESVEKLRKKVADIRLQGGDVNDLRDVIEKGRNLTDNRIKLIIRQETALANSSYEDKKYIEYGLQFFKWMNPDPEKEHARPHHADWGRQSKEDGVLFDINNPPKNPITGKPEKPGEEFNCNCYKVYVRKTN